MQLQHTPQHEQGQPTLKPHRVAALFGNKLKPVSSHLEKVKKGNKTETISCSCWYNPVTSYGTPHITQTKLCWRQRGEAPSPALPCGTWQNRMK